MFNSASSLEQQVRDITNEINETRVSPELIYRMLTRAQQDLVRLTTKKYAPNYMMETVLTSADFNIVDSTGVARVAKLPALNFGYAINEVVASLGTSWIHVKQRPFFANTYLDFSPTAGTLPVSYSTMGDKIYLYPSMGSSSKLRIRYQFSPRPFVPTKGRIIGFDAEAGTMTVYGLSSDVTTDIDSLGAFMNIVDPMQGTIKGTVQIAGIERDGEQGTLTIKMVDLGREVAFGQRVSDALPETISLDDEICHASGSCVPYLAHDLTNYLVELAAFFVKRSLGLIQQDDYAERDRIIEDVSTLWSGRENSTQIRRHKSVTAWSPTWLFRGGN